MKYDLVIIGAGPAGYVAAIRAGQLGMKTALIEKKSVGGMCLNWGCIPTKSFLESAKLFRKMKQAEKFGISGIDPDKIWLNWGEVKKRTDGIIQKLSSGISWLLKKNGVDVISGEAHITSSGSISVDKRTIDCDCIFIATGSYPAPLQHDLPAGLIVELEHLSMLDEIPHHIVLNGKGGIAAEMAQFFIMTGKEVTLITDDEILIPRADNYLNSFIIRKLRSDGVRIITGDPHIGYHEGRLYAGSEGVACDMILNVSKRKAVLPTSDIPFDLDIEGFIATDSHLQTSQKGIYAIGDVNGRSNLAHIASAQGVWAVNHIKGIKAEFDLKNLPLNFYTVPEMAQVGMTEMQLHAEDIDYKLSEFPLTANGKALVEGNTEGLMRVFSDRRYGQVLGVQIIAEHATDMIAEAIAWLQMEGTVFDIAQTVHAHPTVSEIYTEAGFSAMDRAIHK